MIPNADADAPKTFYTHTPSTTIENFTSCSHLRKSTTAQSPTTHGSRARFLPRGDLFDAAVSNFVSTFVPFDCGVGFVDTAGTDSVIFGDASSVVDPLVGGGGGSVGLRVGTGALTKASFFTCMTLAPAMGIGATFAAV